MKTYMFYIPGKPIPKRRPAVNYKLKQFYNTQKGAVKPIQLAILEQRPARFKFLPLCRVSFFFMMPRSTKRAKLVERYDFAMHLDKPDIDNLVKFYLDAMNGIIYVDDRTVQLGPCVKVYATDPGVYIKVEEIDEMLDPNELHDFHPRLVPAIFGIEFDEFLESQKAARYDSKTPQHSSDQQSP